MQLVEPRLLLKLWRIRNCVGKVWH